MTLGVSSTVATVVSTTNAPFNQTAVVSTATKDPAIAQKSTATYLTPSITPNKQPSDNSITIIVAVIFAAIVLLVAVTIALMMVMLSSRSCHRCRKNKLSDEHTAGPTNSLLFSPIPITNGTSNNFPVPSVTSFVPAVSSQPQHDEDDYDQV